MKASLTSRLISVLTRVSAGRESTADLVITDYAMPQMTGLQLIQQIRSEWPAMPVILATGYAELPRDADPTLPKLAKPFFQHDLIQAVNSAVHSGRSTIRILQFRQLGTAQNS